MTSQCSGSSGRPSARSTLDYRKRVSISDTQTAVIPPTRDWRSVVGLFDGSEFMPQVDREIQTLRDAEQAEVERGNTDPAGPRRRD